MRLRSLTVNQFKKFTTPTRLEGIGDGLNLVVGPNELGKSTLLDALRAALFERHRSGAAAIKALQNDRSDLAPVVELVFEVGGDEFTLTKRFIKSPYARLVLPSGVTLESDAAEAELRRLLGFGESGSRGANAETLGMWGVLWVQQGQSFGRPELPESALASLSESVESEVGAVLGGRRARALPLLIAQQRSQWLTPARSSPRGEYGDALQERDQLNKQLDDYRTHRREMSEALEQLSNAERDLSRIDVGDEDKADQDELRQTRQRLEEVNRRQVAIDGARSKQHLNLNELNEAKRGASQRRGARQEIEQSLLQLGADRKRLTEQQESNRELVEQYNVLVQRVQIAVQAVDAADQAAAQASNVLEAVSLAGDLDELRRRRDAASEAEERLTTARASAASILATNAAVERIRQTTNALERERARIGGAATKVRFDLELDQLDGVEVDGRGLASIFETLEAVEPMVISVPPRGRITIEPAIADRDSMLASLNRAQSEVRDALSAAGAESLADAELKMRQRQEHEQDAALAAQQLELLAPHGRVSELLELIGTREGQLTALPADWGGAQSLPTLPTRGEADGLVRQAAAAASDARDGERAARAAEEERRYAVNELQEQTRELQGQIDYRTELINRQQIALADATEQQSDENLALAVGEAERSAAESEQAVNDLEAALPAGLQPQLEARIDRLETVMELRSKKRADLSELIAQLRTRVEMQDSAGIDERIEHTQARLEQAVVRIDHYERELAVLQLLSDTLREAESEAKERYLAPVLDHVRPYLQMLFPNAEIGMDEDFNITSMSRHAGYEERFDHLSMGTQEQIAVLVRLAFAAMLVNQGAPAAVILDDALVFSDDQRMRLMFDILSHAAQQVQIVVFTCRDQLFEGLGARQLQLTPADSESLSVV